MSIENSDFKKMKFNGWTPIEAMGREKGKKPKWLFRCECGKENVLFKQSVISGGSKSCGCITRNNAKLRNTKHGMSGSDGKIHRLYNIWTSMRKRCLSNNSKDFKNYGGRGILICNEWEEFKNFHDWSIENGYSDKLSIDRIDNDGNYEPNNCRWADNVTQSNNRRNTVYAEINGVKDTVKNHSNRYSVDYRKMMYRFSKGYRGLDLIKDKIKPIKFRAE